MATKLRGILVLPTTVFRSDGEIDREETRRVIRFSLEAGASALVYVGGVGEYRSMTEAERKGQLELAVDEVNGRVPVVTGGSGGSLHQSIVYHRHAKENGCVACMTLPPNPGREGGPEVIYDFYQALAEAVDIPIMLHNLPAPYGVPMSAELTIRLMNEIPNCQYIKEETLRSQHNVMALRKAAPRYMLSLLSSRGGFTLVEDLRRGVDGCIVPPDLTDCHVQVWEAVQQGDWDGARQVFWQYFPLLVYTERQRHTIGFKEVLKRRGVITSTYCRRPGIRHFDEYDHAKLEALLERVEPMFRLPMPWGPEG